MAGARWQLALMGLLVVLRSDVLAGYVKDSFLCDDIEAICNFHDLPMHNNSVCGDKHEFLSPQICNCDNQCMTELAEGETCVTSSLTTYPTEMCGPGLECITEDVNDQASAVCTRNPARECINESLEYENAEATGTLGPGSYKPSCDSYGRYAPTQCTPGGTCYCVYENGTRLFGEGPYTEKNNITCLCSTYWEDTKNKGLDLGLRCLTNGNFDPLQCVGDLCFCFDEETKNLTHGPYPISVLTDIPCYDPMLHNPDYSNPCTKAQEEWDSQGDNNTVIIAVNSRPVCTPDGYFHAVQNRGPNAVCVDFNGYQIEHFNQSIHLSAEMDCNCARRRHIMEENGLGGSKPRCQDDGSYYPWQTRGLLAYCVDENGNQIDEAVPMTDTDSLQCNP